MSIFLFFLEQSIYYYSSFSMTYQFLELQSLIISCFCTVSPDVSIEDAIRKWHRAIAS
ncbi:hypothetical protein [Cyanobacterium aponinum]|uniref:hypothetical protein n=1 Tax=Cyanobacterium aponinum TaxID=379064 RepID=UPI00167F7006|nr:hypothetical protein [Cyanobacterium aponinum]